MMILKVLITLFIALGSTFGLPAPHDGTDHAPDTNAGTYIQEHTVLDDNNFRGLEKRAVSSSKVFIALTL